MIKKIALALSVTTLAAPAAVAGGYVAPVVDVAPVIVAPAAVIGSWQGAYVGANVNWGKAKLKAAGDLGSWLADYNISRTLIEPDGVSGAIRAGYDWQFGNGVVGLGAEYNVGKYKEGISGPLDDYYSGHVDVDVKRAATLFARAGYAVNDNFLAYGLLGYTWAKGHASVTVSDSFGVVDSAKASVDLDGVTAGLGAEYRFNSNWSGYAEYAYTDFGKVKDTDGNLKATMQQIKVGVNYRF